ncbi:TMEM165/GDT1 family protein [Candidatus Woesearchaeota archaeon]|nr:TMEM165/GDT1 family protein [Candidatus Woesearchaeota archaeon]
MAFIEPFAAAFGLALISEIADKTQLVILSLALKYRAPWKVFVGSLSAHAFMDGIAITLGAWFGFSLSSNILKISIGILFITLGLWTFAKLYLKKSEDKEKNLRAKRL